MQRIKSKAGDLVRSRSGGPIKTAERVSYDVRKAYARCTRSDTREPPKSFKTAALVVIEPEETEPDRSG